jgi:hypothetical protein
MPETGSPSTCQPPTPIAGTQSRYVVTWHVGAVKTSKRTKLCLSLAICEYSKGVCFIAVHNPATITTQDALKPLIIHDVYVGKQCEDSAWCLNIDCPKNRAIIEALKDSGIETQKHLENTHKNLEIIRQQMNLKNAEYGEIIYYEKPAFYPIIKPNKKAKQCQPNEKP